MQLTIITDDGSRELEVVPGTSVLRALQECGAPVLAACGGRGTCGKCRVLVRSAEGLGYRLACQTPVEDGMRVIVERADGELSIAETGFATPYAADAGEPGELGLSFDIGTTTVVCHLHWLSDGARLATASCPNPQMVFGADVISRINASMEGHLEAMTDLIGSALSGLSARVLARAGADVGDIVRAVAAGNTVMEHIACGLAPDGIGVSPFEPLSLFGDEHALAGVCDHVFIMPCVAGYVGGDITAGIVATGLQQRERPCLFVDIGTNGEMVIGCGDRMVACATAAGPAFEGANISCGMPASPGAISRVALGEGQLELEVIGDIEPVGICGSALVEALAVLLDLGVVDETGRILDPDELDGWRAGLVSEVGESSAVLISRADDIYLTQRDIRNIQLAKAAVHAGILVLLDAYGIDADGIEELLIAGGFGSSIDVGAAARIGLFPPELADCARSVGNAAGEGASVVLVSQEARDALAQVLEACEYLELSTAHAFNGYFVDSMDFE